MSAEIPTWAIEKALKPFLDETPTAQWTTEAVLAEMGRPCGAKGFAALVLAYAKMIAEHEEPPVDPLLVEAREIAVKVSNWSPGYRDNMLAGFYDTTPAVVSALGGLRRGIEIGKQP